MKQCKDKLQNLKQAYKDAKTNNSPTRRAVEEVLASRPIVKMPRVLQSCSESTTSNSPSSSKSSHADSSNSDGDTDSSPNEGKSKERRPRPTSLLKRKPEKEKKVINTLS